VLTRSVEPVSSVAAGKSQSGVALALSVDNATVKDDGVTIPITLQIRTTENHALRVWLYGTLSVVITDSHGDVVQTKELFDLAVMPIILATERADQAYVVHSTLALELAPGHYYACVKTNSLTTTQGDEDHRRVTQPKLRSNVVEFSVSGSN
jgi:hypothetical protein